MYVDTKLGDAFDPATVFGLHERTSQRPLVDGRGIRDTDKSRMLKAAAAEFFVIEATTPDLLREAYRLRHQVYCVERGFEANLGSDMEIDAFDDHAPHVVVCRRTDGQVVGTVRLVLPTEGRSDFGLPMHHFCGPELSDRAPLRVTGEVSRFAVSKERRGLSSDATALLRLALVQGLVRLSRQYGVTHWCAVMERSLLRLLRATAIHFEAVGPMVEYHGIRQPAVASVSAIVQRMHQEQPEIWDFVTLGGSLWDCEDPIASCHYSAATQVHRMAMQG